MTFTKILCPVDFSAGSRQALRTAVRIANERDAELVVMHSWYIAPAEFAGDYVYAGDVAQPLRDRARLPRPLRDLAQ